MSTSKCRIGREPLEEIARVMRAIAHPLRIDLLQILEAEGETNVTDLVEQTGENQSRVSQQLRVLRDRGVVEGQRSGRYVNYSIANPVVYGMLDCIRKNRDQFE